MKSLKTIALVCVLACNSGNAYASDMAENPLLKESTLPYQFPHFDQIKEEHFAPAMQLGMAGQLKEIDAIANNPAAPTFENTLVAMERSGRMLDRAERVFHGLIGTHTNPKLQAIEREMAPKQAAHADAILLDSALFKRIQALYDQRERLSFDPQARRLIERYHLDFVRAGARLSDADKTRLKAMNTELASLRTAFSQNVLKEVNASAVLVETRAELEGMSESAIASAAAAAKDAGHDGNFLIILMNTTSQPPLKELKNRALRERIHRASINRNSRGGQFDTREILARIARLRAERAALLGYETHAAYVLEDETARTVSTVNDLLHKLAPAAVSNARREAAELQKIIDAESGGFELAAWDWDYYAEKARKARYAFDESQIRPYLEMNRVLVDGVFFAATRLYGITFKQRKDLPLYHPDTSTWEVFDHHGAPLALLIIDWYARPSKRGGAWASSYVPQSYLEGTRPVVANHLNIPKSAEGEPTLMTWDQVETAFHEFGHNLHAMFSAVQYPRFSGTSVPRDFVEFPSQVNEMWADWPQVLSNYARHHETGEPLPSELVAKIQASRKFNQGFATTEYLAAALLDQAWHQLAAADVPAGDQVLAFERAALEKAGVDFAPVPPRYRSPYFSHIFSSGYSAGYYSYIWSEVLDADTVEWFKENGGLQRENGDLFRTLLLSRGGSVEALDLFRALRGRDPDMNPLLKRRGLEPQ